MEIIYDGIDKKQVEVKDITPIVHNESEGYPPTRTRAEFDRLMREQENERAREKDRIDEDWKVRMDMGNSFGFEVEKIIREQILKAFWF